MASIEIASATSSIFRLSACPSSQSALPKWLRQTWTSATCQTWWNGMALRPVPHSLSVGFVCLRGWGQSLNTDIPRGDPVRQAAGTALKTEHCQSWSLSRKSSQVSPQVISVTIALQAVCWALQAHTARALTSAGGSGRLQSEVKSGFSLKWWGGVTQTVGKVEQEQAGLTISFADSPFWFSCL